ncbi:hypothetical protein EIN_371330 [Entamoeba invadens IP1]|uniref:Uncharacterized protein n=1 Tax=Entamoeba invadens IP1 TaxID=370355 RepID=A0A0A1UBX9_ENTIV|nr:hypothetical protein EIN_371330 [Entamoeba invadens IP1]ELP92721.1 hypothetical protein EIN_371330 [Entamoeba invadens IP1]|eukprot:XP_004259492.1 hypothetical protein EIN_371330 [Entamoeba invadens IP1]
MLPFVIPYIHLNDLKNFVLVSHVCQSSCQTAPTNPWDDENDVYTSVLIVQKYFPHIETLTVSLQSVEQASSFFPHIKTIKLNDQNHEKGKFKFEYVDNPFSNCDRLYGYKIVNLDHFSKFLHADIQSIHIKARRIQVRAVVTHLLTLNLKILYIHMKKCTEDVLEAIKLLSVKTRVVVIWNSNIEELQYETVSLLSKSCHIVVNFFEHPVFVNRFDDYCAFTEKFEFDNFDFFNNSEKFETNRVKEKIFAKYLFTHINVTSTNKNLNLKNIVGLEEVTLCDCHNVTLPSTVKTIRITNCYGKCEITNWEDLNELEDIQSDYHLIIPQKYSDYEHYIGTAKDKCVSQRKLASRKMLFSGLLVLVVLTSTLFMFVNKQVTGMLLTFTTTVTSLKVFFRLFSKILEETWNIKLAILSLCFSSLLILTLLLQIYSTNSLVLWMVDNTLILPEVMYNLNELSLNTFFKRESAKIVSLTFNSKKCDEVWNRIINRGYSVLLFPITSCLAVVALFIMQITGIFFGKNVVVFTSFVSMVLSTISMLIYFKIIG